MTPTNRPVSQFASSSRTAMSAAELVPVQPAGADIWVIPPPVTRKGVPVGSVANAVERSPATFPLPFFRSKRRYTLLQLLQMSKPPESAMQRHKVSFRMKSSSALVLSVVIRLPVWSTTFLTLAFTVCVTPSIFTLEAGDIVPVHSALVLPGQPPMPFL